MNHTYDIAIRIINEALDNESVSRGQCVWAIPPVPALNRGHPHTPHYRGQRLENGSAWQYSKFFWKYCFHLYFKSKNMDFILVMIYVFISKYLKKKKKYIFCIFLFFIINTLILTKHVDIHTQLY